MKRKQAAPKFKQIEIFQSTVTKPKFFGKDLTVNVITVNWLFGTDHIEQDRSGYFYLYPSNFEGRANTLDELKEALQTYQDSILLSWLE